MSEKLQNILSVWRKHSFRGMYFLALDKLNKKGFFQSPVRVRFPGLKHYVYLRPGTSDFRVFKSIFLEGEYDIALPFIPKTIVDGGGNIGLAALVFANRYPEAQIVTVEPEDSNYEMLKKNTHCYRNITAVKAGIWHNNAYLNVSNPQSGKWAFIIKETTDPDRHSVRGVSIGAIIADHGWACADLIKLDIEGSEKEVFEHGDRDWMTKAKAMIIELHDWMKPGCSDAVMRASGEDSFDISTHGEYTVFIRKDSSA